MNTTTISATELKNKVSEVINRVHYGKEEIIVTKTDKPFVKISPLAGKEKKKSKEEIEKLLDKYFGIWKNEVWAKDIGRKSRYFRKRPPIFP